MSRFFFSCAVMGAVWGLVGGLIDWARPAAASSKPTNNKIPELFMCLLVTAVSPFYASLRSPRAHAQGRNGATSRVAPETVAVPARFYKVKKMSKFDANLHVSLDNGCPAL